MYIQGSKIWLQVANRSQSRRYFTWSCPLDSTVCAINTCWRRDWGRDKGRRWCWRTHWRLIDRDRKRQNRGRKDVIENDKEKSINIQKTERHVVTIRGLSEVNNESANWGQAKLQRLLWSSGCGNRKRPLGFNDAPPFYAGYRPISISQSCVLWGQNMLTSSSLECKKTKQACFCRRKFKSARSWIQFKAVDCLMQVKPPIK